MCHTQLCRVLKELRHHLCCRYKVGGKKELLFWKELLPDRAGDPHTRALLIHGLIASTGISAHRVQAGPAAYMQEQAVHTQEHTQRWLCELLQLHHLRSLEDIPSPSSDTQAGKGTSHHDPNCKASYTLAFPITYT